MQPSPNSATSAMTAATALDGPATALRGWAWVLVSFVGWALTHLAVLLLLSMLFSQLSLPHGMMLGTAAVASTLVGAAVALLAGRLAFGRLLGPSALAWLLVGSGALLSGGVQIALVEWAVARQGYFDPEMIGPTVFLFATLSGTTVAAFGAFVAPRLARTAASLAALVGVVLSLGIVVLNAPGLEGGVAPESVPLMATLLLASGFSIVIGWSIVRRALTT
jgi:hypothetical protein